MRLLAAFGCSCLLFTLAAPARADGASEDPCETAVPTPVLEGSQFTKHRFHLGPEHRANETALLGQTPIRVKTTGCADGIAFELSLRLPGSLTTVPQMAAALLAFFAAHRDALAQTKFAEDYVQQALKDLAAGVPGYRAGDRYCTTSEPKTVMKAGEEEPCGHTYNLSGKPKGSGATEVRFVFIVEL